MDNSSIGDSWKGYNPPPAAAAASGVDAASETDGINVLPPEILSQVFTLLGNDIQSAALVSRSWSAIAKDNIKRKEMESLQRHSKFLADKLDGKKYPIEKKELLRLSKDNQILNCESLGEIKIFLHKVRHNIGSQLLNLDYNDFRNLRKLTKNENMPAFFKTIFDQVNMVKSLNEANLIEDPFAKSNNLQIICMKLLKLGEYDEALKVAHTIPIGGRGVIGECSDAKQANICREFLDRGHFEEAIESASKIVLCSLREKVFETICWSLTQANKVDRAMELARSLDVKILRSNAFQGFYMVFNSGSQFDNAIAVANQIDEDVSRRLLLQRTSNDSQEVWQRRNGLECEEDV